MSVMVAGSHDASLIHLMCYCHTVRIVELNTSIQTEIELWILKQAYRQRLDCRIDY